jgi:N-glycosylase/DNA lyase
MEDLIKSVKKLKNSPIAKKVAQRMKEFKAAGLKSDNGVFGELCFCLLTANYDAEKAIRIQQKVGGGFHGLSEKELSDLLKKLGYRFPNVRSKYIVEARRHKNLLKNIIGSHKTDSDRRKWFAENVKGLGYKEASHFLRNIGCIDCAIIDFHIIDILVKYGIIKKPKTITPKVYLSVESALKKLGKQTGLNMAELDLYLWYMETGKILK